MRAFLLVPLAAGLLCAQESAVEKRLNLDSFEKVWTTVRDKHWDKNPGGLDWQAIHDEFRPKAEKAQTTDEARAIMREMLGRLKQTHFAIVSSSVYAHIGEVVEGEGSPGLDVRLLDHKAIVTRVDVGSPADVAGIQPGWEVVKVRGDDLAPVIAQIEAAPEVTELTRTRSIQARLSGDIGSTLPVDFRDATGSIVARSLPLAPPRGVLTRFGNLPPLHVWFEAKQLGKTQYVAFNMFMDLEHVMTAFGDAATGCQNCDGLVIDLRGNPGGIGGMAMGMAGFLVDKPGLRLGVMQLRDSKLNFIINPRAGAYGGPVAILVDGNSASTSEIFAEGLKDLGRARIFGTRTAAAALPSIFERLPNGDGFQYAIANYVSEGGKPLEGIGVQPDTEVKLTREALLAGHDPGHDPVIDAALNWIQKQRKGLAQ